MTVIQDKERVKRFLTHDPNLRGVGITWQRGRQCVLVNVAPGSDGRVREQIHSQFPEIEFVVQEVSQLVAE